MFQARPTHQQRDPRHVRLIEELRAAGVAVISITDVFSLDGPAAEVVLAVMSAVLLPTASLGRCSLSCLLDCMSAPGFVRRTIERLQLLKLGEVLVEPLVA